MSKVIALAILASLAFLPATGSQKPRGASNTTMDIVVEFGGLMVFNEYNDNYEVGILLDNTTHGHEFCIKRGNHPKMCRKELEQKFGTHWSLIVTNASTTANTLTAVGHGGVRRPDHQQGQYDFNWIIELDGDEFHGKEFPRLELEGGHLKPIIKLPKGELFTVYKSHDMVRWQGQRPADPPAFGFVSEAIGLRVKLNQGQRLVLLDDASQREIFAVNYAAGVQNFPVKVANVRPRAHRNVSDFRMYYKLFPDLKNDVSKQYDFDQNKKHPCPSGRGEPCKSYNLVPMDEKDKEFVTCCSLWCTQVLLTRWDAPLR